MKNVNVTRRFDATNLMVLEKSKEPEFSSFAKLKDHLHPKDLLVMNLSATIPGSLWIKRSASEPPFELRLAAYAGNSLSNLREWWAIAFGAGDWRMPTEERGAPPTLHEGELFLVSPRLRIKILSVDSHNGRLLKISLQGEHYLTELYRLARPIQYSYQEKALSLWDVQTPLAQLPLSVEAPSALFPFSWGNLLELKSKFRIAYLYHGAGISSTGEASLDERLPLPEFYFIPSETVKAWQETRANGGRIIAVGTSVARALESARSIGEGEPRLMEGVTTLRVRPDCTMDRVDGMLTGYHDPLTSHFDFEAAFVGSDTLRRATARAQVLGFKKHEFGDATLLLAK